MIVNLAESSKAVAIATHQGNAKMMTVSPAFRVLPAADVPAGCLVLPIHSYHEGTPSVLVSGGTYLLQFFSKGLSLESADKDQRYIVMDVPLRLVVDPLSAIPSSRRSDAEVGDVGVNDDGCFLCVGLSATRMPPRKAWVDLQTWQFSGNLWDREIFKRWQLLADAKGNGSFELTVASWGEQ